jgi:hypothetical protein
LSTSTTRDAGPSASARSRRPRPFELVDIPRYTLNSLIVLAAAVLFASWAGFAMTRLSRRATGMLVALTLVTLMVPLTALLVSRFAIYRILRLTDTHVPLIAPSLLGTTPFYVLLFYGSFRRLPAELFEACRLEGMGPVATWRRVAMPLVRPVTVAVLAFVFTWSNFLDPLIYLFDERKAPSHSACARWPRWTAPTTRCSSPAPWPPPPPSSARSCTCSASSCKSSAAQAGSGADRGCRGRGKARWPREQTIRTGVRAGTAPVLAG